MVRSSSKALRGLVRVGIGRTHTLTSSDVSRTIGILLCASLLSWMLYGGSGGVIGLLGSQDEQISNRSSRRTDIPRGDGNFIRFGQSLRSRMAPKRLGNKCHSHTDRVPWDLWNETTNATHCTTLDA